MVHEEEFKLLIWFTLKEKKSDYNQTEECQGMLPGKAIFHNIIDGKQVQFSHHQS